MPKGQLLYNNQGTAHQANGLRKTMEYSLCVLVQYTK